MRRDLFPWASGVLLLAAAFYTVEVRREVYAEAHRIGVLRERLLEARRTNDNLALERESLASPGALRARAPRRGEEER